MKRIFNAALIAAAALSSLAVLIPPCRDHEGTHQYRMHTLDGTRWNYSSDWYESNAQLLRPLMEAAAKKYAAEKQIAQRDCGAEG